MLIKPLLRVPIQYVKIKEQLIIFKKCNYNGISHLNNPRLDYLRANARWQVVRCRLCK